MGFLEENGNSEIYKHLTKPDNTIINQKWTWYLALCCVTVCLGSFQFGYNIGSLNLVEPVVIKFYDEIYYKEILYDNLPRLADGQKKLKDGIIKYNDGADKYKNGTALYDEAMSKQLKYLDTKIAGTREAIEIAEDMKRQKEKEIREQHNMTVEEYLGAAERKLSEASSKLEQGKHDITEGLKKLEEGTVKALRGKYFLSSILNFVIFGVVNSLVSVVSNFKIILVFGDGFLSTGMIIFF